VLGLVFADWDMGGVVEEDISGLEDGIREKTKFQGVFVV
jgi:hypothetical protein